MYFLRKKHGGQYINAFKNLFILKNVNVYICRKYLIFLDFIYLYFIFDIYEI